MTSRVSSQSEEGNQEERASRAEKKAKSRRRILDAARDVFFRDGFMTANLDEVAERAGVAKGTLYRYFESKADLYVAVQAARAVVGDAIAAPGPVTARLARLAATEAFCTVAGEAVQLHGGIAITWEHDIQLYFKRAHSSAALLDPPAQALRQLEAELL